MKKVIVFFLLISAVVVYAGQRYQVNLHIRSHDRYYDQNSGNIIITKYCSMSGGEAILELDYDGQGKLYFLNGVQCPVMGVSR